MIETLLAILLIIVMTSATISSKTIQPYTQVSFARHTTQVQLSSKQPVVLYFDTMANHQVVPQADKQIKAGVPNVRPS